MLAAYYARVSTQRQENEASIETQIMAIKDFAEESKHTIVKQYKDSGWSGMILERPALDELRLDARNKVWECVIIYDPDRLARKYSYQSLLVDELEGMGIKVLFVTTPPAENDTDKLMYGVKGLFAEYERARIADRFRLGKLRKAREGHIVTTEASYGYTYVPNQYIAKQCHTHGYLEINQVESKVVEMIFTWVGKQGLTIREVVKRLHELGIKPRKSKRGVWNTSTLTTMLRNETYIGKAHFHKSYATLPINPLKHDKYKKVKKTSRRIRPAAEWIEIPTPRIITDKLFYMVREKLKSNFELASRNRKNEYLLSGKIFCECGQRRIGEGPQKGKHLYYRCTDRVHSFPLKPKCMSKGINARIADQLVWKYLTKFMSSKELIIKQARRWVAKKQSVGTDANQSITSLERELAVLKKEEQRYLKAYGADLMSLEKLTELVGDVKGRAANIEGQITAMRDNMTNMPSIMPDDHQIESFVHSIKELLPKLGFEVRQALVRELVDKITANQQEMTVSGYLPIGEELSYVKLWSIGRDCRVTKCGEEHAV